MIDVSSAVDWVKRNCTHELSSDEVVCIDVLSSIAQPHNLQLINDGWNDWISGMPEDDEAQPSAIEFLGRGLLVRVKHDIATYDGNALTRLVLNAHEQAVRVDISACLYVGREEFDYIVTDERTGRFKVDPDTGHLVHSTGFHEYPAAALRIMLHRRERQSDHQWGRHPSIEEAILAWRGARA